MKAISNHFITFLLNVGFGDDRCNPSIVIPGMLLASGSTKVRAPRVPLRCEAATPASKSKSGKVILATDAKLSSEPKAGLEDG